MKQTKEKLIANLHLMKIHFLILKLFVIRQVPLRMMKIFR